MAEAALGRDDAPGPGARPQTSDQSADAEFSELRSILIGPEQRELRAKLVCAGCPVLEMCREHALSVGEPYGVWGGLSETERRARTNAAGRARRWAALHR